ncbi:MAG TPA: hypothetical protein VN033_11700 [Vulgatibacter sp.]|nr:hypothetical protein [Vulgatibacter sp.]
MAPSAPTAGPSAPACFDAALATIRDDDWREAARLLDRCAELDPAREEIARYQERVGQELLAAGSIEAARRCVQRGDAACAEAALGRLPPESLVAERHAGAIRVALAAAAEPGADDGPSGSADARGEDAPPPPAEPSIGAPNALGPSGRGVRMPPASRQKPKVVGRKVSSRRAASAATDAGAHGGLRDAAASARMVQAGVRARLSDDLVLAAERFLHALAADPSNADAGRELEAIRGRLAEIFRRAHARVEPDPERAARGMRLVTRLAPPGDPLRGKAEEWLARLPAGGGHRL